MKRIRPDYYDKFTCIADKCPITCCQEWKIAVDADTNRKWKKIFPPEEVQPQKKNLSAYTTKKDGIRVIELDEEHKCPFLNENKLCKLVTRYGEKVLSETCTVFPREVHHFETHEEETLMPCCPAVVDLFATENTRQIGIKDAAVQSEKAELSEEHILFFIRDKIAEMFAEEQYSVRETLLAAFYILSELLRSRGEAGAENERSEQIHVNEEMYRSLIEEYFSVENVKQLRTAIAEIPTDTLASVTEQNELLQDLSVNYQKEGLYQKYLNPVITKAEKLSELFSDGEETEQIEKLTEAFETHFGKYEKLMRNFLLNEIWSDLLLPDSDLEGMVVQYQWIAMEYSVIRHCIFLHWLLDGQKEIAYDTVRDYIVIICRMMGYDEEDIYEYLENSFEELIWDWGYLALVVR